LLELVPYMSGVEYLPVAVAERPLDIVPALRKAGLDPRTLGATGPYDTRWVGRIRSLVKSEQPDVLHFHNPVASAGARIGTLGLPAPVVSTEQSLWEAYSPASRLANALTLWRDEVTVAVSRASSDSIRRSPFGRRADVRIIHNAVDPDRVVRDAASEPGVEVPPGSYGTVTHLRYRKGADVLAGAAAILEREFPGRKCLIAGGGPMRDAIRRKVTGTRTVELLGIRSDARSIIKRLEVFVLPSRHEGLPLALLEAMALGRPIVATTVGGVPEVLDQSTAVLVAPGDPRALADGIGGLLRDPDRAKRLGEAAEKAVRERVHVRDSAIQLRDVYDEVLTR